MKTHLTKVLLTLFTIFAIVPCLAQQRSTLSFTYDADGNRITRSIGMKRIDNNTKPNADIWEQNGKEKDTDLLSSAVDSFDAMEVSLYPNPTQAIVNLTINNNESSAILRAMLTTSSGAILYNKKIEGLNERIDLTQYSPGIYYLRLTANEESHTWKIVKY